MKIIRYSLLLLSAALACLTTRAADPLPVYYSFRTGEDGGIARMLAHPRTGELLRHEVVTRHPSATAIHKVSVSEDGRYLAANLAEVEDVGNLLLWDEQEKTLRLLDIPEQADPIAFHRGKLYAGSTAGSLFRLDPATGAVERRWDFRKELTPSGRRPEVLMFDTTAGTLWVSFQKDSSSQKHRGSRIAGIDLRTDKLLADLQLPRDRPELHYDPKIDGKESGPNPEVLEIFPETNTLCVTLDLYGAVGMADLDAARRGELKNWSVHSTAPDGSWGTAFPDRAAVIQAGETGYWLVVNASAAGGAVVVDPGKRQILRKLEVPSGLTTLHAIPLADAMVSGTEGKIKARGSVGLTKTFQPGREWVVFLGVSDPAKLEVHKIPIGEPVLQACPLHPSESDLVFLSIGEQGDRWQLRSPREDKARSEWKAFGRVIRMSR